MGLKQWFFKEQPKENEHFIKIIDVLQKQAEQQNQLMVRLLDQQKDQNETTKMLLNQYLVTSANSTTSLDERLFDKEEALWDEVIESPFKGL